VQCEDYKSCESTLEVCGIQALDQQLTRPEEEEEVAEHKATFLDASKRTGSSQSVHVQTEG
jgi:hypothetical protein